MTIDALKTAMLDSLRMNRSVIPLMLAYILGTLILGRIAGFDVALQIYSEKSFAILFFSFWFVVVPIVLLQLYRHRPDSPVRFIWSFLVKDLRIADRIAVALPCILVFLIFSSTFTSFKSAIGHMHPYWLDPHFARWDSILHGGHAWELIHPFVGFPIVTLGLNVAYNLWLFVLWIVFAGVTVMTGRPGLREQYLLAFIGCWILLGSLAATGLSSVGPCFYGLLYPTDPYAPLMSYLRSVDEVYPVWALSTQDMLWDRYMANATGLGSGISAMPSIHVAIATLNAILLSKLSRTAGFLGWIYLAIILVGSVHLGWHYAIDGYASILGMLVIWRAAGWWVARSARPAPVPAEKARQEALQRFSSP